MLQFITDGQPDEIPSQVKAALQGGVRWVQLRMKDATPDEMISMAKKIQPLCKEFGATFIVNDKPEVAAACSADGVHLGKEDMPPAEARKLLGKDAIIGATANTLDDVIRLSKEPIDYLGIGPYRFTGTKKKLAPVLGLEGYKSIFDGMKAHGITLPYVTIGGIKAEDIAALAAIGATGFAVSGAIAHAEAPVKAAESLITEIKKYTNI